MSIPDDQKCVNGRPNYPWNKTFFYYIVFIMSGLYTDSHKRYSKKIFSQTANPMRRNLKHGIAQHIWNYACVVDIQLHCNVNTHIYIYHIYLHIFRCGAATYHMNNQIYICPVHKF